MARTAPVTSSRELDSRDLPMRQLDPFDDELPEEIVLASQDALEKDFADKLAFNEEKIQIRIHKGREKYAPLVCDLYVNGKPRWVLVETDVWLERKYVEVLARSQPMDVKTEVQTNESTGETINRIHRSLSANYAFSVINDPNPKGREWLSTVMREG